MTNGEKYKGAKERAEAFWMWYRGCNLAYDAVEAFANWLDLEAPAEEPLPCPFCGKVVGLEVSHGMIHRYCCECGYNSQCATTKEEAISAHNRVARAARKPEISEHIQLCGKEANDGL